MITIREPIWKDRSVGIATHKIQQGLNEVEILYTDMRGKRVFPYIYRMTSDKMSTYPIMKVKRVPLRVIPIADFDHAGKIEERVEMKPKEKEAELFPQTKESWRL